MNRHDLQQYRREARRAFKEASARQRGSRGAASTVRHIDPATITLPEIEASMARPASARATQRLVLYDQACNLLRNDARRRCGRKIGDRTHHRIKTGKYCQP